MHRKLPASECLSIGGKIAQLVTGCAPAFDQADKEVEVLAAFQLGMQREDVIGPDFSMIDSR